MLFSENRLRKKKDFEKVLKNKNARVFSNAFLSAKFSPNGLPQTRLGFVVSKKVSKKAVDRNKAKRRLREIIRPKLGDLKTGFDIVVFTRQEIIKSDFKGIKNVFEKLLIKSQLWESK